MRLQKVLWPEIFKGTRGDETIMRVCRQVSEGIVFTDTHIEVYPNRVHKDFSMFFSDETSTSVFTQAKRHLIDKAPNYHICEDFCQALWQIPDKEMPLHIIPDGFFAYISFPSKMLKDSSEPISGAYIYVGPADHKTPLVPSLYGKRICWISYMGDPDFALDKGRFPGLGRLVFMLQEQATVKQMLDGIANEDYMNVLGNKELIATPEEDMVFRIKLVSLLLNAVIYAHSEDSDIVKLTPTFGGTHAHIKKHMHGENSNGCTVPVFALNWDYSKEGTYEESQTFVDTYPRWQRCGPQFSLIKLVWVKSHIRNYHKRTSEPAQNVFSP
jgi:hypothetical protein